jgi:predicted RNase H-like HicB family nuclease
MKVDVIIEKGKDNLFSVNMDYYELHFGLSGFGKTSEEAIRDFYQCWEEAKEMCKNDGVEIPELEFNMKYDVTSFIDYCSGILSKSGLEKITGINQGRLWSYSSGKRKPTRQTTLRIQNNLHRFAKSLTEVQFAD